MDGEDRVIRLWLLEKKREVVQGIGVTGRVMWRRFKSCFIASDPF